MLVNGKPASSLSLPDIQLAVNKMEFPAKGQKDTIIYNPHVTISNIPAKTYDYIVNGKPAIEWIMERYAITTHKESGIRNDPNDWGRENGDPRYILDLLLSVISVSMGTVDIVAGLPKVECGEGSYMIIYKGAHFYKCDFQVHTPRDIRWTGKKIGIPNAGSVFLTEEQKEQITRDRRQFAKEYLEKMRSAGLNAVAITYHHDVTFAKIIRQIANIENEDFIYNSESHKSITVFPGIELTLASPVCQCIIIFDSDFSDDNLDLMLNFLGIKATNEYDENTAQTQRISQEIIDDLPHFHSKLDKLSYCRGKYIILPNIGRGGDSSIIRSGFHEHYVKMPCVGGYVDKNIPTESGYLNKLNGGDPNYGNKSVAIISTSDNRYEDGREFGRYSTWIKWAEPTAEASRQACLARESRISQIPPELPHVYIKSIDVTTSKFLGSFAVNLNQQYNAFIGGRGTGKSTIMEYLRWGLCDQTTQDADSEKLSTIEKNEVL